MKLRPIVAFFHVVEYLCKSQILVTFCTIVRIEIIHLYLKMYYRVHMLYFIASLVWTASMKQRYCTSPLYYNLRAVPVSSGNLRSAGVLIIKDAHTFIWVLQAVCACVYLWDLRGVREGTAVPANRDTRQLNGYIMACMVIDWYSYWQCLNAFVIRMKVCKMSHSPLNPLN